MPGGLDFGDIPTWLAAASPAAVALAGRRQGRVAELGRRIEQMTGDIHDLTERVIASEELEELVNRAVEDAARTTWQEKLNALSRVVAAALKGDETVVSMSLLLEAILARLERPHAIALKHIARSGPATRQELAETWPGSALVGEALLAVLAGEGLIRNIAAGTYDGIEGRERWVVTELGEELLLLLDTSDENRPEAGEVAVQVANGTITVRNQGGAVLRLEELTIVGGIATCTVVPTDGRPSGMPLAPGELLAAPLMMIPSGPAVVRARWSDRWGTRSADFDVTV